MSSRRSPHDLPAPACCSPQEFPEAASLTLFSPAKYGVPAVVLGSIYMAVVGGFDAMLPGRAKPKVARSSLPEPTPLDAPRAVLSVSALVAVVALAATEVLSIDVGALCCALLLISTGCIR